MLVFSSFLTCLVLIKIYLFSVRLFIQIMLSGSISMPATATSKRRETAQTNMTLRSKSQPSAENRSSFFVAPTQPPNNPMRNFFANLLQLTPYRYTSTLNNVTNRSKISSSLSTTVQSDRSSKNKHAYHQSIVSSFSLRSACETRVKHTENYYFHSLFASKFIRHLQQN